MQSLCHLGLPHTYQDAGAVQEAVHRDLPEDTCVCSTQTSQRFSKD